MKKYYRLSWNLENSPNHLVVSILLSAYVMFFVNLFIGSMGGIPAFIGFMVIYYLLRGMINAGNRISHQLAMESKTEIKYLILNYGCIYLLAWAGMKFVLFLSKLTGWGNVKKLTLVEYFRDLYGTTMVEKWAYFFAGILMFSFVMSLFPLVVIRRPKKWLLYILLDSGFFALLCIAISSISGLFIEKGLESKTTCVLDDLLLCKIPESWEAALYIIAVLILLGVTVVFVYNLAVKVFSPKPGKLEPIVEENQLDVKRIRTVACIAGGLVLVIVVGLTCYFFIPSEKASPEYNKVAECLTEDKTFGPVVYGNEVYIPFEGVPEAEDLKRPLGYFGYKGENCDSRFYQLAINNVLYWNGEDKNNLYMMGADRGSYKRATQMENIDDWKRDEVYLLWDEEWLDESAYSSDTTGYSQCQSTLVDMLEAEFGAVEYIATDFDDYDAYFTIYGYKDMKTAIEAEIPYGDWVGCILVKNNNFYYGNYSNHITGLKLQMLLDILGGNER